MSEWFALKLLDMLIYGDTDEKAFAIGFFVVGIIIVVCCFVFLPWK